MGLLSRLGITSTDSEKEDFEPYNCRAYAKFTRVTETFVMLDGTERTFTYDEGVVSPRRASVDENALYRLHEGKLPSASSTSVIQVSIKKVGQVNRESVPAIETESQKDMVAYVEVYRADDKWWQFKGDLQVVQAENFDVKPDDEKTKIEKQPVR